MSQEAEGTTTAASSPLNPSMETINEPSTDTGEGNILPPSTPINTENKPITWRLPQAEEETIEIEEELLEIEEELPLAKPEPRFFNNHQVVQPQQPTHNTMHDGNHSNAAANNDHRQNNNNNNSYNTAADARKNNQHQQQNLGSKPKLTNMSLLSSAVAHATLERCLLGVNGGETTVSDNDNGNNHSKQCKPGHVIDILELRRLSSRGVPDEPPEVRTRASSSPAALGGPSNPSLHPPPSPNSSLQNPHRSYRPLVWRVLLGYLPPQTSLWNDVLSRDRKLYHTLVKELFSSTCPNPHDVFDEEELLLQQKQQQKGNGNEVYRTDEKMRRKDNFVIDDDDEEDNANNGNNPPGTPVESTTPPPPPLTPGLLSARMQQEWVRGEAGGKDGIFHGGENVNGLTISPGTNMARLSPMIGMNTPRTRIREKVFLESRSLEEDMDDTVMMTEETVKTEKQKVTEEEELSSQMKKSLFLPNDDGDDDDADVNIEEGAMMDTINIGKQEEGGSKSSSKTTQEDDATLTHSISITNTSPSRSWEEQHCEGVELCRQSSREDDVAPIPPNVDTADMEENIHLLDEIRKDVIRTHPDLAFFLEPHEDLGQKRYAALERILFVWAKLNKGVRYVQGMNEIVGTLYFVLAHDSNSDWSESAESDTYFLFNSLMVEMRDVFVPDLDEADTGIHGRISNMITLLSLHDPETRCHLDEVGIDPSFYSVRWLTTLLSREFLLPDTIRLWDSMFASTHKDNFLRYVSVTMVMVIRDQLLTGDFSACLRLLQAYPPTNLDRLLESSRALWIYESQITLACHKGGISLGHALRSIAPPPAIIMAYGLEGGIAPPMREQVRQVVGRGVGAANGIASSGMASAGRSFFGNAMNYWRAGSGGNGGDNGDQTKNSSARRSRSAV